MKFKSLLVAGGITASLLGSTAIVPAQADTIVRDAVTNPTADLTFDLINGSPQTGSVTLTYATTDGDGKNGCNLGGQNSQVSFPVVVTEINGAAPTLDIGTVTFTDCNQTQTIGFSATAPGVIGVALGVATVTTNHAGVSASSFDTSGAAFSVTVVDSTTVAALDAPEIANAYVGSRLHNSDCKAAWGTVGKPKQADWHGKLISSVAKQFQGQTFSNISKSVVENAVERSCSEDTPRDLTVA